MDDGEVWQASSARCTTCGKSLPTYELFEDIITNQPVYDEEAPGGQRIITTEEAFNELDIRRMCCKITLQTPTPKKIYNTNSVAWKTLTRKQYTTEDRMKVIGFGESALLDLKSKVQPPKATTGISETVGHPISLMGGGTIRESVPQVSRIGFKSPLSSGGKSLTTSLSYAPSISSTPSPFSSAPGKFPSTTSSTITSSVFGPSTQSTPFSSLSGTGLPGTGTAFPIPPIPYTYPQSTSLTPSTLFPSAFRQLPSPSFFMGLQTSTPQPEKKEVKTMMPDVYSQAPESKMTPFYMPAMTASSFPERVGIGSIGDLIYQGDDRPTDIATTVTGINIGGATVGVVSPIYRVR